MMLPSWAGVSRLFRLVGELRIVKRLYELLQHGATDSRGMALEHAANTTNTLQGAAQKRIETVKSVAELMTATGFTDEEVRDYIRRNQDVLGDVAEAIETLSRYIQNGDVAVRLIDDKRTDVSIRVVANTHSVGKYSRRKFSGLNKPGLNKRKPKPRRIRSKLE